MKPRSRISPPSVGFVLLVIVALAAAGFVWWGLRTPLLETAWRLDIELASGLSTRLSAREQNRLQEALDGHPELAEFLIEDRTAGIISENEDGWVDRRYAYLVRTPEAGAERLEVTFGGYKPLSSVDVRVRIRGRKHQGKTSGTRAFSMDLPPTNGRAELIELRFTDRSESGDKKKRRQAVRIERVPR